MVGVCGTNTFAGRAVPQCPQTAGFTCGAAQETQEIKKEHKENDTTENSLLYISFFMLNLRRGGMRNCFGTGMYIE